MNPEQCRAVTTLDGPVLVLAGAGSGKTRVITCRIAQLLASGVAPRNVLAVTFTNKAANEMRERVAGLVGKAAARELTMGTFHSFCARALRAHADRLGLPRGFAICDAGDQLAAAKAVLRELRVPEATIHPRALQSRISLLKNKGISPEQAVSAADEDRDRLVARAWGRYEDRLRRMRVLDFDDLLSRTVELLARHEDVRGAFAERYRYVLVDEYQDTNGPQYEILRGVAGGHRNLCVVGDDDQSIYGWRGADVRKILGFETDFPGAAVIRLETNYRSTVPILDAANAVIRNNPARHEKVLRSAAGAGEPVRVVPQEDEEREADFVVRDLLGWVREGKGKLGDVAILFRTQTQPRVFEARLRADRVPYVLVGGPSFFDRKEVRDVLAYLRLVENPADETSLLRVINVPARGIGETSIDRTLEFATKGGLPAAAAFERIREIPGVPAAAAAGVEGFRAALTDLRGAAATLPLVEIVKETLRRTNYRAEVEACYDDPAALEARWASVEEVLNMAENHARARPADRLGAFLEALTLTAEETDEEEQSTTRNAVTLMTLHSAKGLEFPRVYLIGVEEGILPHYRSVAEGAVEEERRLMYVGITRARRHLTISYARSRARRGRRGESKRSRFLYEMAGETPPPDVLEACTPKEAPAMPPGKKDRRPRRFARYAP